MCLGLALPLLGSSASAQIDVSINVGTPPPPLPIYDQPPLPGYGFLWMPGYWSWDDGIGDYFWVPGTWVAPPRPGLLWTPPYWGWSRGRYLFYNGYWAPEVGYYGGINYGYGYTSAGFFGGEWRGGRYFYNRDAINIGSARIATVFSRPISRNLAGNRFSFNGPGGAVIRPTPRQLVVAREAHVAPTPLQLQHRLLARDDPALRARANHGRPAIGATPRAAIYRGPGIVGATAGSPTRERPAAAHPAPPPSAHKRPPSKPAPVPAEPPAVRPVHHEPPATRPPRDERPTTAARPVERSSPRPPPPRPAVSRPPPPPPHPMARPAPPPRKPPPPPPRERKDDKPPPG